PGVLTQGGVGGRDLAGGAQHQRDGVFGGGVDIGGGRVDDHDTAFGGGGNIDIVQADPGPGDDLQVLAGLEDFGVDGGGGPHEQRVGLRHRRQQGGPVRAVDPADLDTVTERIDGRLGELVG